MKLKTLFSAFLLSCLSLPMGAVNSEAQATVTHIAPLLWQVTWEGYTYVNAGNASLDANNPSQRAYLLSKDKEETYLYYNKQIVFPDYRNYITVNLEGLNLADGTYELIIPQGYASLTPGGVLSEAQNLSLTIGEGVNVTYTVEYSEVNGNTFDISWTNVTSLKPGVTSGAYMVNVASNQKYDLNYLEGDNYSKANLMIQNDYLHLNFTANYPNLPDGSYKLYIPANYVLFNGGTTGNEAINGYEFKYVAPWNEGIIETNGPDEAGLITFKWVDATSVVYNPNYKGDGFGTVGIYIYDSADDRIEVPYPANVSFNSNIMTVNLTGLTIAAGKCSLFVPENMVMVTVDGVEGLSDGTYYAFDYEDGYELPETPNYEIYNQEATWSLKEGDSASPENPIEVSWNNLPLTLVEGADNISAYSETAGYVELAYGNDVTLSTDKKKLLINVSSLKSGNYRINVPEGCVLLTVEGVTYFNMASSIDNIKIENTGAVNSLQSDNKAMEIYNIHGMKVSSASKLPTGIYIINGKKVIVK